jgi:hypothetical protein
MVQCFTSLYILDVSWMFDPATDVPSGAGGSGLEAAHIPRHLALIHHPSNDSIIPTPTRVKVTMRMMERVDTIVANIGKYCLEKDNRKGLVRGKQICRDKHVA